MRPKLTLLAGIALASICICAILGCSINKEKQVVTDSSRPEWSYDKPFYLRPAAGPEALTQFDEGDIPEILVAKRLLTTPRPLVSDPRMWPRTAIWVTPDEGMTWEKVGYFGLQQNNYYLPVDEDGTYGIRFIGPGVPPANSKPPKPHMRYIVDTRPPRIAVFISPNKTVYHPGDIIEVEWEASDINLLEDSTIVSTCSDGQAPKFEWKPLEGPFDTSDTACFEISEDSVNKTVLVRITTRDRAGNVGLGYSCPIYVVPAPPMAQPEAEPEAATPPAPSKVDATSEDK